MDIEAAKKRSIDGVVETHYQGILLRGIIEHFFPSGYGILHCIDKKDRFFFIQDVLGKTPIAVGNVVGFVGIKSKDGLQAVNIQAAQPREALSFWENTKLMLCGWDSYTTDFYKKMKAKKCQAEAQLLNKSDTSAQVAEKQETLTAVQQKNKSFSYENFYQHPFLRKNFLPQWELTRNFMGYEALSYFHDDD